MKDLKVRQPTQLIKKWPEVIYFLVIYEKVIYFQKCWKVYIENTGKYYIISIPDVDRLYLFFE